MWFIVCHLLRMTVFTYCVAEFVMLRCLLMQTVVEDCQEGKRNIFVRVYFVISGFPYSLQLLTLYERKNVARFFHVTQLT